LPTEHGKRKNSRFWQNVFLPAKEIEMKKGLFFILAFLFSCSFLKAESQGYLEWLKRRDALKQDKSVAAYYTFENLRENKNILQDIGKNGRNLTYTPYKDPKTGKVFDDLQVVEGRWPEKTAARVTRGFFRGPALNIEERQFSAECWFRRQGEGLNVLLSSAGFRDGWQMGFNFWQGRSDEVYLGIGRPVVYFATVTGKKALPENTWHHFAATWDGSSMKVYINGSLVASEVEMVEMEGDKRKKVKREKYDGEYYPTKTPFQLCMGAGTVNLDRSDVTIDLDEVVIYNRVLNEEEIALLGKGPVNVSEKEVFAKADAFIRAGDYKNARAEYVKLKGLPSYGKELALFNMAESYRLEKDYSNCHKTYSEIFTIPGLTAYYRIYGLFRQAEVLIEQKDYDKARQLYGKVLKTEGALNQHLFKARMCEGDTYRAQLKNSRAREIYRNLLIEEESLPFPNDGHRTALIGRLEEIEGLADGKAGKTRQEQWLEKINGPKHAIYVSPGGDDAGEGTLKKPFATLTRAREEIRKLKQEGMPKGGIAVYLRGGNYFLAESLAFGKEDSGTEDSPVVYKNYQGENARLIGGKEVRNFELLNDPDVMRRLPEEANGKIWVADLKAQGITDYGEYTNRGGYGKDNPAALELFCNGKVMQIARWPNNGFARTSDVPEPEGEMKGRGKFQYGKFSYSGDRPERWTEEKDAWLHGYWYLVYAKDQVKLKSIDTVKKTISLANDTRWHPTYSLYKIPVARDMPYYAYNLLSELDAPGEWYLDRDTGKLYFYPPDGVNKSEIIVSTLDAPLLEMNGASHVVFSGLTFEVTRRHGVEIKNGKDNLLAGCTIRNTGQGSVKLESGWNHKIIGCDIYDAGSGGILMDGGDREKLIPAGHIVENNHIYRFNRFTGANNTNALRIDGVGQRVSHNLVHDSPSIGIVFNANDHIMEYNELHDLPTEGREIGAMYIYGEPWYLMSRGNVIRNNFFHHISSHSSPNTSQGVNGIHVDAMNSGLVIENNIFYRFSRGISSTYPGNYLTNNIFIDGEMIGIGQGDRSNIFCKDRDVDKGPNMGMLVRLGNLFRQVRYKQPPWSHRYPFLTGLMEKEPALWGKVQGSIIERNVNTGGPFVSFQSGVRNTTFFENNWDGENPLFVDREGMDFRLRPGSPVFGLTGCEPVNPNEAGVYKDPLRASWPVSRTKEDIGRYYNPDFKPLAQLGKEIMPAVKRISPPEYYTIALRKSPVKIDGKLEKDEWGGMEMKKAMVIGRDHMGKDIRCAKTYAWLMYDRDNLYIGMKHEPDPYKEGMPPKLKQHEPWFEIGIETQNGPHSQGWWIDDMATGPVYIFTGRSSGEFVVQNLFGMDHSRVRKLEQSIEYSVHMVDSGTKEWMSETRIPFAEIGVNPDEVEQLAFSAGTYKKTGFFNWIPTGTQLWRVENAGFIKFAK